MTPQNKQYEFSLIIALKRTPCKLTARFVVCFVSGLYLGWPIYKLNTSLIGQGSSD